MEHMERTTHHGNVGQMEHMDRVAGTNRSHALSLLLLLLLGYSKMCGECMCKKSRFHLVQFTWISGALDADCTWIIGALDADCIVTRVARSVALCQQLIVVNFLEDAWCTQNISGNVGVRPQLFILHCMNSRRG